MMQQATFERKIALRSPVILFACALLFKLALDFSFNKFLVGAGYAYRFSFHFDPLRYALGLGWCTVLFWSIDHSARKASTFLLAMLYLLEIIPVTTIYSLEGGSHIYYHSVCIAFFLCEMMVRSSPATIRFRRNRIFSSIMVSCFAAAVLLLLLILIQENGLPSLTALNIYKVYEMRASGAFHLSKYANYLLTWATNVFLPILITLALLKNHWFSAILMCGILLLIYLYTGQKTFLGVIPLLIVFVPWSKRENFYNEFFACFCIGFSMLILLRWISPVLQSVFSAAYDLLCRRSMLLPAQNKFIYYDYFSTRPRLGLYGAFPQWLVSIPDPLQGVDYGYDISAIYYNRPNMNSNTGFLAEGYMRFGYIGIFLLLQLLAVLLRMVDGFQLRAGYAMTVGVFLYPIFVLADGHLFDSLILGPWMILVIFMLFYQGAIKRKEYILETS